MAKHRFILFRLVRGIVAISLWILSIGFVRNWIWKKVKAKGKKKIVDVEAKIVNKLKNKS